MSDRTARLGIKTLVEGQEMDAFEVNRAFNRLDGFCDLYLKGRFVNTPPSSPSDGDMYLIGGTPTGAWSDYPYKIAYCLDGGWKFRVPFDGLRGFVEAENRFIIYQGGAWADANALISAAETSIASAASCDIGAAGALFLAVTGTTAITGLGSGANRLRFLRFAGALTLTHNATSLVLPGSADIVTAAGDTAIFSSDGSGNWRCRHYARADGRMVNMASPSFTGTIGLNAAAAATLHIKAATVDSAYLRLDDNTGVSGSRNWVWRTSDVNYGDLCLSVSAAAGGNPVGGSRLLQCNATGIGIGGITPSRGLAVTASGGSPTLGYFTGATTPTIEINRNNGSAPSGSIRFTGSGGGHVYEFSSNNVSSAAFEWIDNGSTKVAIGTDGSLLVGTTTNAGAGAIAADYVAPRIFTFATLPATPPNGARAMIGDSSVTVFRAMAAGGGSSTVPVHYVSGTGWLVG